MHNVRCDIVNKPPNLGGLGIGSVKEKNNKIKMKLDLLNGFEDSLIYDKTSEARLSCLSITYLTLAINGLPFEGIIPEAC